MSGGKRRVAVVLLNLGGPDSPDAVRPFLFNLFADPAIIGVPAPLRHVLAAFISHRRAHEAQRIYAALGGASPLLALTREQAGALERALGRERHRVFIAMRYWHPLAEETAREVAAMAPERVVLLPLYPQFSTTTTASSLAAWARAARAAGVEAPQIAVCCYPRAPGLVAGFARKVREALAGAEGGPASRVLFTAHGLPRRVLARGDPYQWQSEETARAIAQAVDRPDLDWRVCYQSRVGRLAWIGPETADEIRRAGAEGKGLILAPISFVSEHSETLVELDIRYRELAQAAGVPRYVRIATPCTEAGFIDALAALVRRALGAPGAGPGVVSGEDGPICPAGFAACPHRAGAR